MSEITLASVFLKPILRKDAVTLDTALGTEPPDQETAGNLIYAIALTEDKALLDVLYKRKEQLKETSQQIIKKLWLDNFEAFKWVWAQGTEWQKLLSNRIPAAEVFTKTNLKANRECRQLVSDILDLRPPDKLTSSPHLVQWMLKPSKAHIISAACGKQRGCYNLVQLEAIRPGSSNWFEVRESLVGKENPEDRSRALFEWLTYKDQPDLGNEHMTLPDLTGNLEPELPG